MISVTSLKTANTDEFCKWAEETLFFFFFEETLLNMVSLKLESKDTLQVL